MQWLLQWWGLLFCFMDARGSARPPGSPLPTRGGGPVDTGAAGLVLARWGDQTEVLFARVVSSSGLWPTPPLLQKQAAGESPTSEWNPHDPRGAVCRDAPGSCSPLRMLGARGIRLSWSALREKKAPAVLVQSVSLGVVAQASIDARKKKKTWPRSPSPHHRRRKKETWSRRPTKGSLHQRRENKPWPRASSPLH